MGASLLATSLVLILLEVGLRLVGFGHPAGFFLPMRINERDVLVENAKFGQRFFPAELARSPSPLVMPAKKAENTYRIFILGESAALGDPEPAFGFGRFLKVLLQERFPGAQFEVVCTATTAINSHAILPIARDCARQDGNLWIVYMGNNEFVGPYGAASVVGSQVPNLGLIRFNLALKATRTGQLLDAVRQRMGFRSSGPETWGGMKMFLNNQVGPDDPRKQRVYAHFQKNLEDILGIAETAGVEVIGCTVASNLKDCAPFASRRSSILGQNQANEWIRFYAEGTNAEVAGDFARAVTNYRAAAGIDASVADLQFRLGRCQLQLANVTEAGQHFAMARDFDALPFRADTRINEIIKKTVSGRTGRGIYFADTASALAELSPNGIPGTDLFLEHVHFNFDGNYRLARIVADQVLPRLPESMTKQGTGDWASFELCSSRLGLTDWDRRRVYENVFRRLSEAPFVNQLNHADQLTALRETLARTRTRLTPAAIQPARAVYQAALAADPDDFYLRGDFAKLQEDTGEIAGAIAEWQRLRDLLPYEPAPYYFLGKLLAREGKTEAALQNLSRALEIRPDLPDAMDEKAQLLFKQKKMAEALVLLEHATRLQPGNARVFVHMADVLAALDRRPEGVNKLREAVRLQPTYWEARYLLGVELAAEEKFPEATEQFSEVVRLNPNYALGHLNLGVALAKQSRAQEASFQFHETLRLEPTNRKAGQYLETIQSLQRR